MLKQDTLNIYTCKVLNDNFMCKVDSITRKIDNKSWKKYIIEPIYGSLGSKEKHFSLFKPELSDSLFFFNLYGIDNIFSEEYYKIKYNSTDYFIHKNLDGIIIKKHKSVKIPINWTLSKREIYGEGILMIFIYNKNKLELRAISKMNVPFDIIEQENDTIFKQ